MILKIRNPIELVQELTQISSSLAAGSTTLEAKSTQGLAANGYIILGKIGTEQAELRKISSVTDIDTFIITAATSFPHPQGALISEIAFNQIEISRKASASSSYSVIATVDIDVDDLVTTYDDTSGQSTSVYRVRLYNATTGQYSDYSPELKGTGFSSRAVKPMIDAVLRRLRDPKGEFHSREAVMQEIQFQYEELVNSLIQASAEYYRRDVEIPMESFKYEYSLPDDFREVHEVLNGDGSVVDPSPRDVLGAEGVAGYEMTDRNRIYFNDVPTPATDDVSPLTVLDNNAYNEDGTWAATLDATNVTTDNDEYKTGTGSINFDIDVSVDASNTAVLTNSTFTAVDLDDYEDTGRLRMWVYLPDVTYMTSINLKWGSSSTDTWDLTVTKDYKNHAFHDGWNLLEFNWASTSVTETGTPDASAVDYIKVTFTYSSRQDDDTDFRIDSIRIANAFSGHDVYRVVYYKQPDKITNEMDELELPPGYSSVFLDGVVGNLMVGEENRNTLATKLLDRSDKRQAKFISQSSKRTRRPMGFRPYGYKRNYSSGASGKSVNRDYDVYFPRD